ncbi:VP2 [Microvirus sp.]|nr:VP2 [Microvirus sp.]
MSFLGDAAGAVAGAVGEYFGTASANALQQSMFNRQMAFNREVMQNRHQWEVEDLKKAGLNPLLSATSPTGTLSAPGASAPAKANYAQSAQALASLSIQNKQAEAQLASSEAAKLNAESLKRKTDFETGSQFDFAKSSWQSDFNIRKSLADSSIATASEQQKLIKAQTQYQKIQNIYLPYLNETTLDSGQQAMALALMKTDAEVKELNARAGSEVTNAQANMMLAVNAEKMGVSQRSLNAANAKNILKDVEHKAYEYRYENKGFGWYDFSNYFGKVIKNFIPILGR